MTGPDIEVVEVLDRQIVIAETEMETTVVETHETEIVTLDETIIETVDVLTEGPVGARGEPGVDGLDGRDGRDGADGRALAFEFEQTNPSDCWNVIHPLGREPVDVSVFDESGERVWCEVQNDGPALTRILPQPPMSGKAYLL